MTPERWEVSAAPGWAPVLSECPGHGSGRETWVELRAPQMRRQSGGSEGTQVTHRAGRGSRERTQPSAEAA